MSTPKADLEEISLRIKYESFAKLTAELSTAHSFQDVATVLQINLKYIFNFSSFRILVFYESEKLQFEITRQHTAVKYEDVTILPITAEVIKSNIAVVFNEQELTEKKDSIYPLFHPPLIKHLCLYPLRANEHQCLIIGAGNKNNQPPVDADFRFLKLVGEYLLSKLTQLILTERLERMVKKRTEQLNLANQELSTLFYRASHDFNAPMTTLLGLARLCRMQVNQPEEVLALLQHTTVVISQAQTMFKKFKVISEAEIQETSIDRIAIHPFLQKHIDQFNFKSKEKGIKLDYTATGEQHILFSIDILAALLENLTENAIQFHRFTDDSFIHIAAHSTPSLLTLRVMDNGMGIAKDQQSTIFNLYTRANENSKGNGLGLYLVKRIVEKLKGTVRVESELNKGSQFEITIPLGMDSKV